LIKLILAEPGERSKAIQILLKLENLDQARRNLTSAVNKVDKELKSAQQSVASTRGRFLTAAGVQAMKQELVVTEVNLRRSALGLTPITELTAETNLAEGISASAAPLTGSNLDLWMEPGTPGNARACPQQKRSAPCVLEPSGSVPGKYKSIRLDPVSGLLWIQWMMEYARPSGGGAPAIGG
jgi:hypothetical protein